KLAANGATADIAVNANVSTVNNSMDLTAGRNITLNAGNLTNGNIVGLSAGGQVAEAGAGFVISTDLVVTSVGGASLPQTNNLGTFDVVNRGGDVLLVNSSPNLNITGVR